MYTSQYNAKLMLSCTVSGASNVTWYKNGAVLMSLLYDGNMLNVGEDDVPSLYGIYQCYALNDVGNAQILYCVLIESMSLLLSLSPSFFSALLLYTTSQVYLTHLVTLQLLPEQTVTSQCWIYPGLHPH